VHQGYGTRAPASYLQGRWVGRQGERAARQARSGNGQRRRRGGCDRPGGPDGEFRRQDTCAEACGSRERRVARSRDTAYEAQLERGRRAGQGGLAPAPGRPRGGTAARTHLSNRMPNPDEITLTLPHEREYHRVAHLVLGGLAVRLELTIETLEDLQLALST